MTTGYADLHSHLVPDVDDGARDLDESLHAVGRMVDAGVRRIVTTPHLRASEILEAEKLDIVDRQWEVVKTAVSRRYPELDFRRGFEIQMNIPTPNLSDPRLRLGGTEFVLVEWPGFQVPPRTTSVLARLRDAGWVPIVAHPERYDGIDPELEVVRSWKDAGAYLQCNYGSLVDQYGPVPARLARQMLAAGLLDYLSSDFHGRTNYNLYLEPGVSELLAQGGEEQVALLAKTNPTRLFDGLPPLPVPPLELTKPLVRRMRTLFRA